jgi:hypothetical protein
MYRTINLYGNGNEKVATVVVPPIRRLPTVLLWGSRVFVSRDGDHYREAASLQVFTPEEYEIMTRDGIVT